jgi:hypothetical protein
MGFLQTPLYFVLLVACLFFLLRHSSDEFEVGNPARPAFFGGLGFGGVMVQPLFSAAGLSSIFWAMEVPWRFPILVLTMYGSASLFSKLFVWLYKRLTGQSS